MYVGDWLTLVTVEGALCGGGLQEGIGSVHSALVTDIVRGMQFTTEGDPSGIF